jgi:hypothetical protein
MGLGVSYYSDLAACIARSFIFNLNSGCLIWSTRSIACRIERHNERDYLSERVGNDPVRRFRGDLDERGKRLAR